MRSFSQKFLKKAFFFVNINTEIQPLWCTAKLRKVSVIYLVISEEFNITVFILTYSSKKIKTSTAIFTMAAACSILSLRKAIPPNFLLPNFWYVESWCCFNIIKKYFAITAQKMKLSIKDLFSKCDQIHGFLQFPADLVTFTEEILNEILHFLCSVLVLMVPMNEIFLQSHLRFYLLLSILRFE